MTGLLRRTLHRTLRRNSASVPGGIWPLGQTLARAHRSTILARPPDPCRPPPRHLQSGVVSELSDPSNRPNRPPIRWWPAWVVTGCTGAATAAIRFWPNASFQQKNMWTAQALILGLLLLLAWTLALSRLRWRTRLSPALPSSRCSARWRHPSGSEASRAICCRSSNGVLNQKSRRRSLPRWVLQWRMPP